MWLIKMDVILQSSAMFFIHQLLIPSWNITMQYQKKKRNYNNFFLSSDTSDNNSFHKLFCYDE